MIITKELVDKVNQLLLEGKSVRYIVENENIIPCGRTAFRDSMNKYGYHLTKTNGVHQYIKSCDNKNINTRKESSSSPKNIGNSVNSDSDLQRSASRNTGGTYKPNRDVVKEISELKEKIDTLEKKLLNIESRFKPAIENNNKNRNYTESKRYNDITQKTIKVSEESYNSFLDFCSRMYPYSRKMDLLSIALNEFVDSRTKREGFNVTD